MTHTFVGDLNVVLAAPGGAPSLVIYKYVGATTATSFGRGSDLGPNSVYGFADSSATNFWTASLTNPIPAGTYRTTQAGGAAQVDPAPVTSLDATFGGLTPAQANGTWTLTYLDCGGGDTGTVSAAHLMLTETTGPCATPNPTPSPSETPTPTPTLSPTPTPPCTTYTIANSTGAIVPGTDDIGNHTDDGNNTIALPFPVSIYGNQYTTAEAGSNGYLSFGTLS